MTESCTCTTNPKPHGHNYLHTRVVAAAVIRPVMTIDSWRKRGILASVSGGHGQTKVCACCAVELAEKAPVRWQRRVARKAGRSIRAKAKVRDQSVAA